MRRKDSSVVLFLLLIYLLFILSVIPAFAVEDQVTVYNASDLKEVLEDPAGSNIKLGANIKFPASLRADDAVEIPDGKHFLDLNGFTIEYSFINSSREYSGTPIRMRNGQLTINGNGAVKGGRLAIEVAGWNSVLTINGGSFSGAAHSAIRVQGVAIINGGDLEGRFGDVWLDGGLLVDNAGVVERIDKTTTKIVGADIRNGKLTGETELHIPLTLKDLEAPVGSSLTIRKDGILNITGVLTGEERIKVEGGVLIKNGVAVFEKDRRLTTDLNLNQLTVESAARVMLDERMKLTVKGNMTNNGDIDIQRGSILIIERDLINSGTISYQENSALVVKGKLINNGIINQP